MFHVVKTHSNRLDVTILIPNPTSIMKTEIFFSSSNALCSKRKDGQTEYQENQGQIVQNLEVPIKAPINRKISIM